MAGQSKALRADVGCYSLPVLLGCPVQTQTHSPAAGPTPGHPNPRMPQIQRFSSPLQGQLVTMDYPGYALAVIGLLVVASTMCIPLGALLTFVRKRLKRESVSTTA